MKNNKVTIDFFLVGAARCGTTSLYNYLNSSKHIFLPRVKEPNFFSDVDSPKSEDFKPPKKGASYHTKIIRDLKVYNELYVEALKNQLKGDSSPSYIWDTKVAKKLYHHNPNAKIIISLRHPVDRAYSHYVMNYYTGNEKNNSFEKALKSTKNSTWGSCNEYLEMGYYYNQVKAYYDLFPKEQIKILVYEDWTRNINSEIGEVFKYLGISVSESVFSQTVESNKIKPVKRKALLNMLRQNKIKGLIKSVISQGKVDALKTYFFYDYYKEVEIINTALRLKLSKNFKNDISKLSDLTDIDFKKKWK